MRPAQPVNRVHSALKSLNCDARCGLTLLIVCTLLLLPSLAGEAGRELLRYDRGALEAHQWWRLLTAHVVHLSLRHALLNALGLLLLGLLFAGEYSARAWLLIVCTAALAIDAGLWLGDSTLQWYVGSSGVLHGVLAAGTLAQLRRGERQAWLLAALLCAKLLYEHFAGALPLSGTPVVVQAHLYGALGGLLAALPLTLRKRSL